MKKPEILIKSQPIDFELAELLGEKPSDFLVLCFDGVPLEDFGTPYDTPRNRFEREALVDLINDRSEKSLWPQMWDHWNTNIRKQFGLPETATEKSYRPVVSYKISRVVHGYSEHLHAAIGLFEALADKAQAWSVRHTKHGKFHAAVMREDGAIFTHSGDCPAICIAEAVRKLLLAKTNL